MNLFGCIAAVLAIALITLFLRWHGDFQLRRQRLVRERVAYLLWTLVERGEEGDSSSLKRI